MASSKRVTLRKKPFAWNATRVKRSPFKRLNVAKKAEAAYLAKKSVGFTATSSLKAMGRVPRSNGGYLLGPKYS